MQICYWHNGVGDDAAAANFLKEIPQTTQEYHADMTKSPTNCCQEDEVMFLKVIL